MPPSPFPTPELVALSDICARLDGAAISAALREARPWNVIHLPSVAKIDLIPRKETAYRRAEFERRVRVELAGVPLWIVSVEDADPLQSRMVARFTFGAAAPRYQPVAAGAARPRLSSGVGGPARPGRHVAGSGR